MDCLQWFNSDLMGFNGILWDFMDFNRILWDLLGFNSDLIGI